MIDGLEFDGQCLMTDLDDNVMNRQLTPDEPKFKIWSNVGLMLTYRCPSRCRCCYVFSGPDTGDFATEMSVEMAISCWQAIQKLAGPRGKVHITGGEPFCEYERLKNILQRACAQKLAGLQKIETNAYWCSDPGIIRERLSELKQFGLAKLQISADIYHQEYIPIERIRLAESIGREVLGEHGVQVRWHDFMDHPVLIGDLDEARQHAELKKQLDRRSERLVGRAAEELVNYFLPISYEDFDGMNCSKSILGARHVHVDGAGNIFSGTCIGIRLVVLDDALNIPLDQIWRDFDAKDHPIWSRLIDRGPLGLLELAVQYGFTPQQEYAGKCHFCYQVRKFLYRTGRYNKYLGPGICYGMTGMNADKENRRRQEFFGVDDNPGKI